MNCALRAKLIDYIGGERYVKHAGWAVILYALSVSVSTSPAILIKLGPTSTEDSFCGSHLVLSSKTDRVSFTSGVLYSE
jgi:hypothetical protein